MANYVKNRVTLPKEAVKKYITDNEFDFNKVVTQPKEIEQYNFPAPLIDKEIIEKLSEEYFERVNGNKDLSDEEMIKVLNEMELESNFEKDKTLELDDGNVYNNFSTNEMREVFCYLKTGYQNWYEFNNEKWGTKWNACDTELREHFDKKFVDIEFYTAYCTPEPIFDEIKAQNPDIEFTVTFYDENLGINCGILEYSQNTKQFYDFDMDNTDCRMTSVLFAQGFDNYELEMYIENRFIELDYEDYDSKTKQSEAKELIETLKNEFIEMKDFSENNVLPLTEEIVSLKELVKTPIEEIEQTIKESYEHFKKRHFDKIKDVDLIN